MTILDYAGQPSVETDDKERIATLTRKGWVARPERPHCGDNQTVEWDGKQWRIVTLQPPAVDRVATAALLIVLRKRGLRDQLDAVLASLPAEQAADAQELLQMPYTRRDHPLVEMIRQAFGWTDAEVDALFAEADAV
jgi:hypothetical protein